MHDMFAHLFLAPCLNVCSIPQQFYKCWVSMYIMAKMKNTDNTICWGGYEETGSLIHYSWWECKMVQPLLETVWQFLSKLNTQLPYSLVTALLGIYPREIKTYVHTHKKTVLNLFAFPHVEVHTGRYFRGLGQLCS